MDKLKLYYMTIYDQVFSHCGKYLAAANNFGKISIFNLSPFLNDDDCYAPIEISKYHPSLSFEASDKAIFSLSQTPEFLIAGGIGSICAWRWSDLKKKETKELAWSLPVGQGEHLILPEVNALLVDSSRECPASALYAGCGDNAIYCWDLETRMLKATFKEHTDYIHDISLSSTGQELLSAGEDGAVKIWDTRSPSKSVHTMLPYKDEKLQRPNFGKWISSVDFDANEDWMVCGGGPLVSVWYLRTLSAAVILPQPETTTFVTRFQGDSILIGGSEPSLKVWDFGGDQKADISTSAVNVFSLAVTTSHSSSSNQMISVGGRGNKIDICTNLAFKDYTFHCD